MAKDEKRVYTRSVEQKISIAKEWLEEHKGMDIFRYWEYVDPQTMINLMEEFAYQTLKVNARAILEEQGCFVDNLWHVDDVMCKIKCDEDEAQEILHSVLTNDWIVEQMQISIDDVADELELPRKEDND